MISLTSSSLPVMTLQNVPLMVVRLPSPVLLLKKLLAVQLLSSVALWKPLATQWRHSWTSTVDRPGRPAQLHLMPESLRAVAAVASLESLT